METSKEDRAFGVRRKWILAGLMERGPGNGACDSGERAEHRPRAPGVAWVRVLPRPGGWAAGWIAQKPEQPREGAGPARGLWSITRLPGQAGQRVGRQRQP